MMAAENGNPFLGKIKNFDHCFKTTFTWNVAFNFASVPTRTGFRSKSFSVMPFPALEFYMMISKEDSNTVSVHICQKITKCLKAGNGGLRTKVYLSVNRYHDFPQCRILEGNSDSAYLTVDKKDVVFDETFETRKSWIVQCTLFISGLNCLKTYLPHISVHKKPSKLETNGELLLSGQNSDITLKTDDSNYKLHKDILQHRTKLFRTIADQEQINMSSLKDIPKEAMNVVLKFIYTAEFSEPNQMYFLPVYKAARIVGEDNLAKTFSQLLVKHFNIETIFPVLRESITHNDIDLELECIRFIAKPVYAVQTTIHWKEFKNAESKYAVKIDKAVKYFRSI